MVRVIEPTGTYQITNINAALNLSKKYNLDLVEVAPQADPPVCRIMNYGKFVYQQKKKIKDAKSKKNIIHTKELRFKPAIDTHDLEFKIRHAINFLQEGNKVKATVLFKGRSILYIDKGKKLLETFAQRLEEYGTIENDPAMDEKKMTVVICPIKKKK